MQNVYTENKSMVIFDTVKEIKNLNVKKVWSDLRLRSIKRLSEEFTPKPKKVKYKSKKNKLLETLNSAESIYSSYGDNSQQNSYLSPTNIHDESHNNNPLDDENVAKLHNTEQHFLNSSHDTNSYDVNSLAEEEDIYHNECNNYTTNCSSPRNAVQTQLSEDKMNYLCETLSTLERQIKNQNIVMEHLTKITSNLAELMERHVTSLEKQNNIMEKQLRATEYHNVFLRREEAKRKMSNKNKVEDMQKS